MPPGPKGEDGKSAYQVWVDQVNAGTIAWPKGEVAVVDFFRYLKGKDGVNGKDGLSAYDQWVAYISSGTVANPHKPSEAWPKTTNTMADFWYFLSGSTGENGKTPHIGADGNWWIGTSNTGVPARGEKGDKGADGQNGKDGLTPAIGPDGNWWIGTTNLGVPARGKDGKDAPAPTIVANPDGNWWVNGVNTGKSWKGEKGDRGTDAVAPVVTIGINDNWFINGKDTGHPSRGKDGENGKDAASATVKAGDNGNWFISTDGGKTWEDTGKPWKGKDGISPEVVIGPNKNWWINGKDSGHPAYGKDGSTPYIGSNGNWWVNIDGVDKDLKVPATGPKGDKGDQGVTGETPHIGSNGNWWVRINGVDTDLGVPATGPKGDTGATGSKGDTGAKGDPGAKGDTGATGAQGTAGTNGTNGINGKSAYQLWVDEIAKGVTPDPHDPLKYWPKDKNSLENFWEYLRGRDGGSVTYKDNEPTVPIVPHKYNVLPLLYNGENKEYAYPADGKVKFKVYGKDGNPVGAGVQVKGLPGAPDATVVYTTDSEGNIEVPATGLPDKLKSQDRVGEATVIVGGVEEKSAPNTLTPDRVTTRIRLLAAYPRQIYSNSTSYAADHKRHVTAVKYVYEREIDDVWSEYPADYPPATVKTAGVKNLVSDPLAMSDLDVTNEWYKKWNRETSSDFLNGKPGSFVAVIRPAVLTDDEKSGTPEAGGIAALVNNLNSHRDVAKSYEWDNQKSYFTVYGVTNFYGEQPVMNASVHNPEIYPSFGLEEMKIDVIEGMSIFYGKFMQNYQPYYYKHEQVAGTNKWESPKQEGNTLMTTLNEGVDKQHAVQHMITITTFNESLSSSGSQNTTRTTANTNMLQFALNPFYHGNYVSTCVRINDEYGKVLYKKYDWDTYKSFYYDVYRSTALYRLERKTDDTYSLHPVYNPSATIALPKQTFVKGWDK